MNRRELTRALDEPTSIKDNGFNILKSLASLVSRYDSSKSEDVPPNELVLKALENESLFQKELRPILYSITLQAGLHPYLKESTELSLFEAIDYEAHRPINMENDGIVLHNDQLDVYLELMNRKNVILSAPTSYGKSLLIDTLISSKQYKNIVVIVPTVALIDETRRRLLKYSEDYQIITHSQQRASDQNIIVMTQERFLAYNYLGNVDLFIIDEFYKLDPRIDFDRSYLLNLAFLKLFRTGAQFYLLGPNIHSISKSLRETLNCEFIKSSFTTVYSETEKYKVGKKRLEKLVELCKALKDPTLIYCPSHSKVREVANALIESKVSEPVQIDDAVPWLGETYDKDWIVAKALEAGIGIHHGRLPRPYAQYIVRAFNQGKIKFLVCTSTLIEGVNTSAKNIIIYEAKIGRKKIDYFTYNNIRGRAGRMFKYFSGHIYSFDEAPEQTLPEINFPAFNPTNDTPAWLLLHLDYDKLKPELQSRIDPYHSQNYLDIETLKINVGIDLDTQIELAKQFKGLVAANENLIWRRRPNYDQVAAVCQVLWDMLIPDDTKRQSRWVRSPRQLAFFLKRFEAEKSLNAIINLLKTNQEGEKKSIDEAVEGALEFSRTWMSFIMPRYLRTLNEIQKDVIKNTQIDYSSYADSIENQFLSPALASLEEYGIPLSVAQKMGDLLPVKDGINAVLSKIKHMSFEKTNLTKFEKDLVQTISKTIT